MAATLTDPQIAYIRAKSGDNCAPIVVSDPLLQVYYDTAERDMPTTIVSVLEDRWAKAKADAGRVTDFGTSVDRADMDHIEDLLNYWRKRAGISDGTVLTTGVLSLGIDYTCDDLEAEWQ